MNFTTMQTTVAALAGDESNVQFSVAQIGLYLNWGQKEMARRLELLQKTTTYTTLDSTEIMGGVVLPSDFDQELHVFWNNSKIARMEYATFYEGFTGNLGTENATCYTLANYSGTTVGRRMVFWPYQALGRTGLDIDVIYQSLPADMVAPTDNPVLPEITHETLCLYALSKCKLQENDYQAYKMIMQDYSSKMMELSSLISESDGFSYEVVRAGTDPSWPAVLDG